MPLSAQKTHEFSWWGGRKSALSMQADGIAEVGGVGDFLDEGGSGVMLVSFRVKIFMCVDCR